MRLIVSALVLALGFALPGSARDFASPEALLEALYAPFLEEDFQEDYTPYFSESLNALHADYFARQTDGVGALDFDPVINGQDFSISEFEIGTPEIHGDAARVEVSFLNFDQPQLLVYSLVEEEGAWKVDDIESSSEDFAWRLSDLLVQAD